MADEQNETEKGFFEGVPSGQGAPPPPPAASIESQVQKVGRRKVTWRSPLLMLIVIGVSGYLTWSIRGELEYFFSAPEPIELGDVDAYTLEGAQHNRYARIAGLHSTKPIGYKRLAQNYRVNYLVGTRIFVREDRKLEENGDDAGTKNTSDGGGSYYPTYSGSGRLLSFDQTQDFEHVRQYYSQKYEFKFDKAWILLDGVEPGGQWQYPLGAAVLVLIALGNLFLLVRTIVKR